LGSWRREHRGGGSQAPRTQPVVPIWRRVEIPSFNVEINVDALIKDKRQRIDITPTLVLPAGSIPADIYSARVVVHLTEPECATEQTFVAALGRARTRAFASFWRGFLDVRLISVPTEPTVTRVAVRLVNDSPIPAKAQSDFLDANLYGV